VIGRAALRLESRDVRGRSGPRPAGWPRPGGIAEAQALRAPPGAGRFCSTSGSGPNPIPASLPWWQSPVVSRLQRLQGPLVVAAAALAWLAIARFAHPIGDVYTESDFYGGYATGAIALRHGHLDPSRYGIVGPGFEALLAASGARGPALFAFACLLAVGCAAGTLACWSALLAPRIGRAGATLALLLIAATPVFTRYAYSATTDMPAVFFASASLACIDRGRRGRSALAAGALGAFATLTRYPMAVVLIAGPWLAVFPARPTAPGDPGSDPDSRRGARGARARRAVLYLAGFAALAGPWLAISLPRGAVPGQDLARHYRFYISSEAERNTQDVPVSAAPADERDDDRRGGGATEPLAPLAALWARRSLGHLGEDARSLVGPWLALLAVAGAIAWARSGAGGGFAPLAGIGLLVHLALVPSFYSPRYRLMMVPFEAACAAALLPALWRRGRAARAVVVAAFAVALVTQTVRNVAEQAEVWSTLPRDVLATAPRLVVEPGRARVMSRKGHIGYYSGRNVTMFPRVSTLAALAGVARGSGTGYLYYSWYEARLRPEFVWLLDSTAAAPGLERIAASADPPAYLFRIGPEFGREPPWMSDDLERLVHVSRASMRILPDSATAPERAVLAADALRRGDLSTALRLAREARMLRPDLAVAWRVEGMALKASGRLEEADRALRAAAERTPRDSAAGPVPRAAGPGGRAGPGSLP
jgi:hypothetical protein